MMEVNELRFDEDELDIGILPTAGVLDNLPENCNPWRSDERFRSRIVKFVEWLQENPRRIGVICGGYRMMPGAHVPAPLKGAYSQVTLATRGLVDIFQYAPSILSQIAVVDGREDHSVADIMSALSEVVPKGQEPTTSLTYFSHRLHYRRVARTPLAMGYQRGLQLVESGEDGAPYQGRKQVALEAMAIWDPTWRLFPGGLLNRKAQETAREQAKRWCTWSAFNQEIDLQELDRHQRVIKDFQELPEVHLVFSPPPIE